MNEALIVECSRPEGSLWLPSGRAFQSALEIVDQFSLSGLAGLSETIKHESQ
jgi:hypothetical protein